MGIFAQDLRYAVRRLTRSPGFTVVAVLSLALGIGANTAIFSLVNTVLLRDLPVRAPDELVEVYFSEDDGYPYAVFSYPDFADLRESTTDVFSGVIASQITMAAVEGPERTEFVMPEMVSGNYFELLGVEPVLGRSFLPEEDEVPGARAVAVLSHDSWQSRFGGDPDVLGRTFRMNGRDYEVVGVAPESFKGTMRGLVPELWVPMMMAAHLDRSSDGTSILDQRGSRSIFVKGRLRPGVSVEEAQAAVATVASRLAAGYPETNEDREMTVVPTKDVALHPLVDRALLPVAALLMTVVGLVLLIACANLASFLLARATDRRREIAVRLALGAKRRDLVRQLLTETVLLALLGGAAAVLLAHWTLQLLVGFQPPLPFNVTLDVGIDGQVLLFTLGVSVLAGIVFGLAPALQATNPDVAPTLKDEAGSVTGGRKRFTLRNALVVLQVAVSLLLLVGSGLFLRSLQKTQAVDPGFDTGPGAVAMVNLELAGIERERWPVVLDEIVARTRAIPGVTGVGLADRLPLGVGIQLRGFDIPGVEPPAGREYWDIDFTNVDPGYFEAWGVEVPWGRAFTEADGPEAPTVAIVSEAAARRFWPGEDPVGKVIRYSGSGTELQVVGVARDTKVRTLGEAPRPFIYVPLAQEPSGMAFVVARRPGDETGTVQALREAIHEVDPDLVILQTQTITEHLSLMLFAPRMGAALLSVFGFLALALAAIGLYGVISYVVSRRTREVGIRMSMGAAPGDVVRLVLKGGMGLVAVGMAIGLALALGLSWALRTFLYGISTVDPVTFLGIPGLLILVAGTAALVPALRASRVNPVDALRSE